MQLLKPLSICLDRLQSDTVDSVKEWLALLKDQSINKILYLPILENIFGNGNGNGLTVEQK